MEINVTTSKIFYSIQVCISLGVLADSDINLGLNGPWSDNSFGHWIFYSVMIAITADYVNI